jgi:hypothetical protein
VSSRRTTSEISNSLIGLESALLCSSVLRIPGSSEARTISKHSWKGIRFKKWVYRQTNKEEV